VATKVLTPNRDACIADWSATDWNIGAADELEVGDRWYDNAYRSLVAFDLATAFSGISVASIESVTLSLLAYGPGGRVFNIAAARILIDWGEGDNTSWATAGAGECSWNNAKAGSVAWTTPACDSQGNDRNAFGTPVAAPSNGNRVALDVTGDVALSDLSGSTPHYGWVAKQTAYTDDRSVCQFYSRENATPANWPTLTFEYTEAGGIPAGVLAALMDED